jgi:cyclopropane fatty-acyl-phospholipid synthase-like methyltransferase
MGYKARMHLVPALLLLLALAACAGPQHRHGAHHRFDDAEAWAQRFESPERDAWQRPDEVIAALKLAPDAKVADIGAATGYFPVRLARVVPKGRVYGVDVESSMVEYLARRAARDELANLTAVQATPDDPKLPEPVDLVLLVNTYHHIEKRPAYFARLAGALRPGGRVAVIDFRVGSSRGPPDSEKVSVEQLTAELAEAGYAVAERLDFLPEQHFVVFSRAAR